MISAAATFDLYGRLVEQVGAELNLPSRLVQRTSYGKMNDLLEQGLVDCALICTGAYVEGRREGTMEALVVPTIEGKPTYRAVILVREDSGIEDFAGLRGKRFAYVDPLSNTGCQYAVRRVLELGFDPKTFFDTVYTHSHDKSIRALQRGIVDGASVDELVFEHVKAQSPRQVEGLKVIERSEAFGAPPIVAPRSLRPEERVRLRRAFLQLPSTPRGKRILEGLGVDGFVLPRDDLYRSAVEQADFVRTQRKRLDGR